MTITQAAFTDQQQAVDGLPVGPGRDVTVLNNSGNVRQVDTFTVDIATASTAYTFSVDGYIITYTSAASGVTVTTVRDGLLAAAYQVPELVNVVAFQASGAATITVTALVAGTPFTPAESDTRLLTASVTANAVAVNIPFGRAVTYNTADPSADGRSIILPSATGQVFKGVLVRSSNEPDPPVSPPSLASNSPGAARVQGQIWVVTEEAVDPTNDVYFRFAAGPGGTRLGAFRTDADTASADQLTTAKWAGAYAAGRALLDLGGA